MGCILLPIFIPLVAMRCLLRVEAYEFQTRDRRRRLNGFELLVCLHLSAQAGELVLIVKTKVSKKSHLSRFGVIWPDFCWCAVKCVKFTVHKFKNCKNTLLILTSYISGSICKTHFIIDFEWLYKYYFIYPGEEHYVDAGFYKHTMELLRIFFHRNAFYGM
jgi:hypothetical protein